MTTEKMPTMMLTKRYSYFRNTYAPLAIKSAIACISFNFIMRLSSFSCIISSSLFTISILSIHHAL